MVDDVKETQPLKLDDLIAYVRNLHPDDGPLQHLADAMVVSEYLGDVADHLIGHFVDQARRSGASWTEIGQGMGVTKQAAQKRFVPRETTGLFSRFTDRARNVVTRAHEEAQLARQPEVQPVHLVLGLTREHDGLAVRCLRANLASLDEVETAARAALGPRGDSTQEHVPFSAGSKKVLELTTREALRLGHNYVGTEHILLAMLADENPVLTGCGLTHDAAERWIVDALAELKRSGQV